MTDDLTTTGDDLPDDTDDDEECDGSCDDPYCEDREEYVVTVSLEVSFVVMAHNANDMGDWYDVVHAHQPDDPCVVGDTWDDPGADVSVELASAVAARRAAFNAEMDRIMAAGEMDDIDATDDEPEKSSVEG